MFNNRQDAQALCKRYGYPDLFLTITCNPKWIEIQRHLSNSGNYASYRPDICCRVFHLKLQEMMADFKKGHYFGKVIASKTIKLRQAFFSFLFSFYITFLLFHCLVF